MATEAKCPAGQILSVIPLATRVLASQLRQSGLMSDGSLRRLLESVASGPLSIDDLAEIQEMSLPAMSSCVTTLTERGWVSRTPLDQDRRRVIVALTPAGRAALDAIDECLHRYLDVQLRSLSPEDCQTLANGLSVLERLVVSASHDGRFAAEASIDTDS